MFCFPTHESWPSMKTGPIIYQTKKGALPLKKIIYHRSLTVSC